MISFDKHRSKIISSFLTNLSAGWFLTIFISSNTWILMMNLIAVILSLEIAVILEKNSNV